MLDSASFSAVGRIQNNLANTNVVTGSVNAQVCAHRYVRNSRLHGKCFFTDGSRTLANFQEYDPCDEEGINFLVMLLFYNIIFMQVQ